MIEAPRGTFFHDYDTDENGLLTRVNLIVATGNNNWAMNKAAGMVAKDFVDGKKLTEGVLNRVEVAIRCYDPRLSCATHALGQIPLEVTLVAADSTVLDRLARWCRHLTASQAGRQLCSPACTILNLRGVMPHTLIVGYGNLDRSDDGIAHQVTNVLRRRLGQEALSEGDTGLEDLGVRADSIFLTQLVPDLIDTLVDHDQVIFVDAHVLEDVPDLHYTRVFPAYVPSPFTHHMTPEMLLALPQALHHLQPCAHVVSIRGHDFDFHRSLSAPTAEVVGSAVEHIRQLLT